MPEGQWITSAIYICIARGDVLLLLSTGQLGPRANHSNLGLRGAGEKIFKGFFLLEGAIKTCRFSIPVCH